MSGTLIVFIVNFSIFGGIPPIPGDLRIDETFTIVLTLEVTNDNFHGVHCLELYIYWRFTKIIALLILVAKI